MKLKLILTIYTKISSKWTTDENIKHKITKLLLYHVIWERLRTSRIGHPPLSSVYIVVNYIQTRLWNRTDCAAGGINASRFLKESISFKNKPKKSNHSSKHHPNPVPVSCFWIINHEIEWAVTPAFLPLATGADNAEKEEKQTFEL